MHIPAIRHNNRFRGGINGDIHHHVDLCCDQRGVASSPTLTGRHLDPVGWVS